MFLIHIHTTHEKSNCMEKFMSGQQISNLHKIRKKFSLQLCGILFLTYHVRMGTFLTLEQIIQNY